MKCKVKDCENHSDQGMFIGFLCSPCYTFLTTGEGVYSQLYRNTVAAEREACAKVCMEDASLMRGGTPPQIALMEAAAGIRARGQE